MILCISSLARCLFLFDSLQYLINAKYWIHTERHRLVKFQICIAGLVVASAVHVYTAWLSLIMSRDLREVEAKKKFVEKRPSKLIRSVFWGLCKVDSCRCRAWCYHWAVMSESYGTYSRLRVAFLDAYPVISRSEAFNPLSPNPCITIIKLVAVDNVVPMFNLV